MMTPPRRSLSPAAPKTPGAKAPPATKPTPAGAKDAAAPPRGKKPLTRGRRIWRIVKWSVRGAGLAFLVGYIGCWGLDGWFYYPTKDTYYSPEALQLRYEDVTFPTSDGLTLHGWFLPANGPPRGTVVHFHGNAGNVSAHVPLVADLPWLGYNVLMFDYRGFGQSTGRPSRAGTIKDGHAALDYALSRPEVDRNRVYFWGQSLGGAVAIVVAADRPEVRAVVAEATFGSYRRIASAHLARLVKWDGLARAFAAIGLSKRFDPIDAVARIAPRPLLVIAGGDDEICFPELGRELFEAAAEPKEFWLAPGAKHLLVIENHSKELLDRMQACFNRAPPP